MVSRNTRTVRAMAPNSFLAWVAGIRAEVSPAASRVIASASPLSGRVMLRPIHQLKASPISTAAQPTQMMNCRVRACDADSAAEAAETRSRALLRILSAIGIAPCVSLSIKTIAALTVSTPLTHWAKASA
jgi:hypothetical protein